MQREYNKHTKKQKNTSANPPMTTPQGPQSKKKSIIKLNVKSNSKKQGETPLNKALEVIRVLLYLILVVIIMLIIFSLFLVFFSAVYRRLITFSVFTAPPALAWFIKKLNKKKPIKNPDIKNITDFFSNIKKVFKKFIKKSAFIKNLCSIIFITITIAFVISFSPKLTAKALDKIDVAIEVISEIVKDFGSEETKPEEQKSEENNTDSTEISSDDSSEKIDYPPQMSFILHKNNFENKINSELIAESFLYNTDEPLEYLYSIYNTKESTNSTFAYYKAQKDEDSFTEAVSKGKQYKTMYGQTSDWYDMLPKEQELWSVIEQQKSKAEIYPSNHIYNSLSNNYQRLAIEYHNQNENKETIKYLYLLSIKYEIKCIEYATNQTELYESLDRIATRYEDILFCCDCNEQEIIYLNSLSNLINGK